MTERAPISAELRPFVDLAEAGEIDLLGHRLRATRPTPDPEFHAALRAALEGHPVARRDHRRPQRLGLSVATCGGGGLALLVLAYLGATGSGPLG